MLFKDYADRMRTHFEKMCSDRHGKQLFMLDVTKDELWDTYMESFPVANGERQTHNCNSCRQFIKAYGGLVAINDHLDIVSIWDFAAGEEPFRTVNDRMWNLCKDRKIRDIFLTDTPKMGKASNDVVLESGLPLTWHHLAVHLPLNSHLKSKDSIPTFLNDARTHRDVLYRGLSEITHSALTTTLELIEGGLYRGEPSKVLVEKFLEIHKKFHSMDMDIQNEQSHYVWKISRTVSGSIARLRNTSIGTMLVNLSGGMSVELARKKYEEIVAPANYKRPKPVYTESMIQKAQKTIISLGMEDSLPRRAAVVTDLTVNNAVYVNRSTKSIIETGNIFEELSKSIPKSVKDLKNVTQLKLSRFLDEVAPFCNSIKMLIEPHHRNRLMSLVAPVNNDAPSMFQWDNAFSWCYTNGVADSIKEKVIAAGGKVKGKLRVSLAWGTTSDLDLHIIEPGGTEIYFQSKKSHRTGGELDVDMNAGGNLTTKPVENIIYPMNSNMGTSEYTINVHNYAQREGITDTFTIEIEHNGVIKRYKHVGNITNGENVYVGKFSFKPDGSLNLNMRTEEDNALQTMWGLDVEAFEEVSAITLSPNYWGENQVGNKHVFMLLRKCKNPEPVRGVFNEFLRHDLTQHHKKVFEALGSKMMVEKTDDQLSGVGFSTTSEGYFVCEVTQDDRTKLIKVVTK